MDVLQLADTRNDDEVVHPLTRELIAAPRARGPLAPGCRAQAAPAQSYSLPPCGGGLGWGVSTRSRAQHHPLPDPPPSRGSEKFQATEGLRSVPRSGLLELDERAAEVLWMQEQHGLAVG